MTPELVNFGCSNPNIGRVHSRKLCEEDWVYTNRAVIGATYGIETTNLSGGADTVVSLHDNCGPSMAVDDNGGAGLGSLIE